MPSTDAATSDAARSEFDPAEFDPAEIDPAEFDPAEFDHFSQHDAEHPEHTWAALRSIAGLARSERHGGFRVISRYEDLCAAARDPELFSSAGGTAVPPHPMPPLIPVDIDPPMHGQYRKLLAAEFGPAAVARHEAEYRALADELLAAIPADGEFDFCAAFSAQFPERVALRTIGFDEQDRRDLGKWFHDLTHLRGIDEQAAINAAFAMFGRVQEVITQRRAEPRRADLLSVLLDGHVTDPASTTVDSERGAGGTGTGPEGGAGGTGVGPEGGAGGTGAGAEPRPLRDDEILMYVALLLFGGLDTTASAISGAFYYLAQHPADRERLLSDDVALDRAVEEFVRWTTPVQGLGRTVTADTELAGCPLHAGDRVMLLWGAGNRDETVFDAPDEIRLDRFPNRHLGFGMGPHRCMGSHLAKVMVKIAIERGVRVLGDFELADPTRIRWATGEARGIVELPLRRR